MNTKQVVILVTLGAALSFGGKTMVKGAWHGTKAIAHAAAKPVVWTAKRLAK